MLSQKYRISNQRLIEKLNRGGSAYRTSHFVFKFLPSHSGDSKFAAVISKKISSKAVHRNRLRRQMTESLRLNFEILKQAIVCLIILKKGAQETMEYGMIDAQIKEFFNRFPAHV